MILKIQKKKHFKSKIESQYTNLTSKIQKKKLKTL